MDFVIEAPPLPTVSLSADKTTVAEGETATITLTLSRALTRSSIVVLTGSNNDAVYSSFDDYHFTINQGVSTCTRMCQVDIPANKTSVEVIVNVNEDSTNETTAETFSASLTVNQVSQNIVQIGSPSTLNFTIPADSPSTLGFAMTGITTDETIGGNQRINTIRGVVKDAGGMKLSSIPVSLPFTVSIANNENDINGIDASVAYELTPGGTTNFNSDNEFAIFFPVIVDDTTPEPQEEIVITLIEGPNFPSGWIVDPNANTFTITINASDQPSTLGFAETGKTVNEPNPGGIVILGVVKDGSGMKLSSLPVDIPITLSITNNGNNDIGIDTDPGLVLTPSGTRSSFINDNFAISRFTVTDDTDPEGQEEFVITLGEGPNFPSGWIIDPNANTFTITVNANDPLPTVSLNYSGSTTISEGVQIDDRMMIRLSEALTQDVTFNLTVESDDMIVLDGASGDFVIQYRNSSGTRIQCGNLMQNSQTLVRIGGDLCEPRIRAGSTSIALSIITIADGSHTDTTAETFTLSVSIPSASASLVELGSPSSLTFTIPAEPTSTLGFAETGRTVDETSRTIAIRGVVKDASGMKLSSIPVTLPYTLSITNNDDGDINIDTGSGLQLTPTGTTNFNSDNEFAMHSFITRDDTTPEPQEEFVVTLGEGPNFPSGWIIDPNANTFTITVNANDQPSTLGFAETGRTTDETRAGRLTILGVIKDASGMKLSSLPVSLPITLSISNNDDPDIEIDTAPGHELSPSGVVFNSDNDFTIQSVQIIDDTTPEPQEEFVVTLGEGPNFPSGWIIDPNANTFTITINANDQPVTLMPAKTSIEEGTSTTITLSLNQALASDAVFNLTSGGGATYGTTDDWNLSVNETDCNMASGTNCQVTISKGNTSAEVTVRANLDLDTESPNETFTVTVAAASGSEGLVTVDSSSTPLSFSIQDEPPPAVSLNYGETDTTFQRGTYPRFTVDLSKALTAPVTLDITGSGTGGTYSASGGWFLYYRVAPAGETSYVGSLVNFASGSRTCRSVANAGDCQITVPEGSTIVDIQLFVSRRNTAGGFFSGGTITVSLGIPTASENLVVLGTPSTHTLTLQ
ncbi:MAG: hypothetical protein OXE98_01535 [Hyphomicrobiales bacterium]|nr:hypothetical protein [Hyphomicrobiales bacterium]